MAKPQKPSLVTQQLGFEFSLGEMCISEGLAAAISASIKACKLSRYQIACQMSELLDREITKSMIDHWSSTSHSEYRIPADAIPAFCQVTKSTKVMDVLAAACCGAFASGKELQQLEIVRMEAKIERYQSRVEQLKKGLK